MVAATTKGGAQLSFAERKSRGSGSASKPRPTVPPLVEGDGELTRDIERPLPGDVVAGGGRAALRSPASRHDLASKRSAYFQDVFASRGVDSAKEKIRRETMILAEVRTNVIVGYDAGSVTC